MLEQEFNNQSPSGNSSNTPSFHDELELKLLVAKTPGQKFVSKNDFLVFSSIKSQRTF
jgi:hypothetical protein